MSSERPPQDGPDERPTLEMPVVKRPEQESFPSGGSATKGALDHEQDHEGNYLNDDAHFLDVRRGLLAAFDGVSQGGLGEIASRTVKGELAKERLAFWSEKSDPVSRSTNERIEHVFGSIKSGTPLIRVEVEGAMHDLLLRMDAAVGAAAARAKKTNLPGWKSMATTAVIAKIWEDDQKKRFVTLGNIGDSRGYLLRDKKLLRLTHDQTFVQMLVDAHLLSDDEAIMTPVTKAEVLTAAARRPELHRLYAYLEYLEKSEGKETFTVDDISNMVLQSVGSSPVLKVDDLTLTPEIVTREVEVGNLIILTTDGVHGNLVDEKIAKFAARFAHDAQGLADALVNGALDFTLQHDPKNEPRLHADDMTAVVMNIE